MPSSAKGWKVSLAEMLVLRDMMVWATSARSGSMNRGLDAPPRPWYVLVLPWAGPGRLRVLLVQYWPPTTTQSMATTTHNHPPSPTITYLHPPPPTPKGPTDAPRAPWRPNPSQL